MNSRRALLSAVCALAVAACADRREERQPSTSRPSALAVERNEPTYHSDIPKAEIMAKVRAQLAGSVDAAALDAGEAELNAYTYTPSSEPEPSSDPGRPAGASFSADARTAAARAAQLQGGAVEIACAYRPCVIRGDFDGDGLLDLAVQVARKQGRAEGIGLLLSASQPVVLAAGNPGPLGADTIWATGWSIEPSSGDGAATFQALGARPVGATLRLTGPEATGVAFLERSTGGGVQLKSAVIRGVVK